MSFLAPIHRPTSVRHALRLNLLSAEEQCLVLAKANRLEVYTQNDETLQLSYSRTVYGKITFLQKLRPSSSATDHLLVGTDRNMYFTAAWDPGSNQLETENSYLDQADKTSRDSPTQDKCLIDPTNAFIAMLLYDGIVTIMPLISNSKKKALGSFDFIGSPIPTRISDLFVRSCTFLYPHRTDKDPARLAFLFEDSQQRVCLSVRALDYAAGASGDPGSADLENVLALRDDIELGASHLIPIPGPVHGILVLAETKIFYFRDVDDPPIVQPLQTATQFVAWTELDEFRWLMADDFGTLYLFMLLLDDSKVSGWKMDALGKTSRASVLVYLDGGHVFIGSHQGDSQVIRIVPRGIELLQTISNIAPILDFTIMDMGNRSAEGQTNEYSSGQARLVTGSGVFDDGSLRSVRSGVGLEEQGLLGDMENATNIFALRSTPGSKYDDLLVVSFINESRAFMFSADGEVEEQADCLSLRLTESTLLIYAIDEHHFVQVTPSSTRLVDIESSMMLDEWSVPTGQSITSASASGTSLLIAVDGLELAIFTLRGKMTLRKKRQFPEGQIACVHVSEIAPHVCMVGFWQSPEIAIVKADDLTTMKKQRISDDPTSIPRSILLKNLLPSYNTTSTPTLLVSMANGEVVTFAADPDTMALSSQKATVLGTEQANLIPVPGREAGLSNVFATCDHPSLIYGSEGRIVYSAVTAEKATSVCSFNSELYPGALAIATPEDIRIALVDAERTTHVQTLHVGELVRRVAYSPSLKAFGIGTIQRRLLGTEEIVCSRFKLADEVLFKELDSFDLNEEELVESVIRAEVKEDEGDLVERFIVGTTYMDDNEQDDAIRGRILVFAVVTGRALRLITELPVKGACRALACIDGRIVAALVKTVVIYALNSSRLQKLCTYRTSTAPIDLAVHEPTKQIAIADLMKSISIVTYRPPSSDTPHETSHKLEETGRHFQTAWSTAVARVGPNMWLESDAEGNLIVLAQDPHALTEDDKRRLRPISDIRLGEMVNRIRPIKITVAPTAVVAPSAFMATVEGGVYLFGLIGPSYLDLLIRLQAALAPLVASLGKIPFNKYRAYRSQVREAEEPERFVDGELVEAFLDLSPSKQEQVVEELGAVAKEKGGLEGIREMVESLRRLH